LCTEKEIVTATKAVFLSRPREFDSQVAVLEQGLRQISWSALRVKFRVIPHLYDLPVTSPIWKELTEHTGDIVLLCCLYPRAAYWVLEAHGVHGQWVHTSSWHQEDQPQAGEKISGLAKDLKVGENLGRSSGNISEAPPVDTFPSRNREELSQSQVVPQKKIWCFDLRRFSSSDDLFQEILAVLVPKEDVPVSAGWNQGMSCHLTFAQTGRSPNEERGQSSLEDEELVAEIRRRWYPVVDYSRCRRCLQCLNFCLFGVYGLDKDGTLRVAHPDACRDGCPACARLCPTGAIIFPMCPDPLIAGAMPSDRIHAPATLPLVGFSGISFDDPRKFLSRAQGTATESSGGKTGGLPAENPTPSRETTLEQPDSAVRETRSTSVHPLREEELDRYVQDVDAME
jgi:NAD-dependent dihydropyrimidine dehydrogenase PreA subunit